jgi:hypothetical protein
MEPGYPCGLIQFEETACGRDGWLCPRCAGKLRAVVEAVEAGRIEYHHNFQAGSLRAVSIRFTPEEFKKYRSALDREEE